MRKTILHIYLALTLGFISTSCNDWLDGVEQTSKVSDEIVWEKEEYVDKNVNAFYTFLHKYGQFGDYQFRGSLTESLTETFKYGSITLGDRGGWPNEYVTNPDVILPDEYRLNIWDKDKAYGVILYTDLDMTNNKARSSAADTWQLIADDLDFASTYLPKTWNAANKNRVTKGAAYALKSRAMLYAERWQDAYNAANEVLNLKLYDLVDNYAQAWKGNNVESILEFDYDQDTGPNHDFDQYHVPQCDGWDYGALGTPTQEMVESYETKDGQKVDWTPWHGITNTPPPYDQLEPRFAASIIYRGSTWKGRKMDCSVNGTNGAYIDYGVQGYSYGKTTTGYFLRKLMDESLTDLKGKKSHQPWVEIRYAEVLLNKAEAAYRLNKIDEAQKAMNDVRARKNVGLPGKSSTGETWFNDYRNERKVELAYEGHLYWDMRRWKLAHTEYTGYRVHGMKITGDTYEYVEADNKDRKFLRKLYVFPVPTDEMRNNSLIEQYDEWK